MVARAMKRKLQDRDEGGGLWENQLQSVLDISWNKYHRDQALVDPSLLRSVLINNTLRQVQSEVRTSLSGAGSSEKQQSSQSAQPELSAKRECTPVHSTSVFSQRVNEDEEDDFLSCSSDEDLSLSSAISAILKSLDAAVDVGYSPSVPQRSPLASVENVTGDGKSKQSQTFNHKIESFRTSDIGTPASVSGFFQDAAIDDFLLDIDTTVFDGEMNSFGSRTFSFPADDLVRYLPSLSSSSPASSSSSGSREMQELEHIMDILIHS